ncbi:MAG: Ig-like domain-containing protein [Ruminiclostridium sp.]|nr:Ig-like domain-containing protein [Ruminiclostridium sp.]
MESKQITLHSQTRQCPHCGEYYSVTYKYCPFCDVGRKEEERRQAERKKQRQSRLSGVLGGEPEKKKKRSESAESRPERTRREPAQKAPAKKKESIFFKKEPRKKTSELTEEEKKARLAEREARAAERKRLRDQAAREAAMSAEVVSPILEDDDLGIMASAELPDLEAPAVAEQTVPAEAVVSAEIIQPEAPVAEPAPAEDIPDDPGQWEILRNLDTVPGTPVVEVDAGTPETPVEPPAAARPADSTREPAEMEEDLDALLSEIRDMLSDSPVPRLRPEELIRPIQPAGGQSIPPEGGAHLAAEILTSEPEVATDLESLVAVEPGAPVAKEPETPVDAEPETPKAVESEPSVVAEPETPEIAESEVSVMGPTEEVSVTEAQPQPEQPTIVLPNLEGLSGTKETPTEDISLDDQPTQVLPVVPSESEPETPDQETSEEQKPDQKAKKKKSKVVPVILSLVLIAAAVFIVVTKVVPVFQDGLFSASENKDEEEIEPSAVSADTVTMDQAEAVLEQEGQTLALTAIPGPEGAVATVTWVSDAKAVATVDENGVVTATGPGDATITAILENGYSTTCVVHCTWATEETPPAEPAGPALTASTLTLSSEGETKQIQVTGAQGEVKWSSDKSDVATVSQDGTVTAVSKGGATVTAEVDGKTLTCEVKCIW